jgi:Ca2+-transporting ATPase
MAAPGNPFQYSPEKLASLHKTKHLKVLDDLGGIDDLARVLMTNLKSGLSPDEDQKWKEAENSQPLKSSTSVASRKTTQAFNMARRSSTPLPDLRPFKERRRIFGENTIPTRKPKTIPQLMWSALHDKILVLPPERS